MGLRDKPGNDLLSHARARAVPSALEGLTSEFGMGSGMAPPTSSPEKLLGVDSKREREKSIERLNALGACTGSFVAETHLFSECRRKSQMLSPGECDLASSA